MNEIEIFLLWDMNADSWTGIRTLLSIHQTLDGALEEIPDEIKKESNNRGADDRYVVNFTYLAIEKRMVGK